MLCSFQQERIVSPAISALIALRSANTYYISQVFEKNFSQSIAQLAMWNSLSLLPKPRLSWFESWEDGDQSAIDSTALLKKWLLPIAFEIIEMTWNDLNLFCQLYGFKSPYHLKLLLNHIVHHMTALGCEALRVRTRTAAPCSVTWRRFNLQQAA